MNGKRKRRARNWIERRRRAAKQAKAEREQREQERRCDKTAMRDVYVTYAARARAAGCPDISPRDYYCGCGWPDPLTWLPQCDCRRKGAENSPISFNNHSTTENPVSPPVEHA